MEIGAGEAGPPVFGTASPGITDRSARAAAPATNSSGNEARERGRKPERGKPCIGQPDVQAVLAVLRSSRWR